MRKSTRLVPFALALTVGSTLAVSAWAQWGASGSLFTEDGIEVSVDARVVSTFAMLNALGFDREKRFGPAPLYKPDYSKGREKARGLLGRPGKAVKEMKRVVDKNQKPTTVYVDAALRLGPSPAFKPAKKRTKKLTRALVSPLSEWFAEEGGSAVVRAVVAAAGPQQKAIVKAVNPGARLVTKKYPVKSEEDALLEDAENEKGRVVVVVNPVDMHGTVQRLLVNGVHYVVVGPRAKGEDMSDITDAVLLAHARSFIDPALSGQKLDGTIADAFDKLPKAARKRIGSKSAFAGELIACGLMKAAVSGLKTPCQSSVLPKKERAAWQAQIDPKVTAWLSAKTLLKAAALEVLGATPTEAPPATEGASAPEATPKTPAAAPATKKPLATPAAKPAPTKKP